MVSERGEDKDLMNLVACFNYSACVSKGNTLLLTARSPGSHSFSVALLLPLVISSAFRYYFSVHTCYLLYFDY